VEFRRAREWQDMCCEEGIEDEKESRAASSVMYPGRRVAVLLASDDRVPVWHVHRLGSSVCSAWSLKVGAACRRAVARARHEAEVDQ
jgi:hypothetical protein